MFGLKVWVVIGISVGAFMLCILFMLVIYLNTRNQRKLRNSSFKLPISQIPTISREIKEVKAEHFSTNDFVAHEGILLAIQEKSNVKDSDKVMLHLGYADEKSHSGSFCHTEKEFGSQSGDEGSSGKVTYHRLSDSHSIAGPSPLTGLPELSHLGWGHWFTLRDLETATNRFAKENIIGEGGYGVVYRGQLINGTSVAIKKLLNNL